MVAPVPEFIVITPFSANEDKPVYYKEDGSVVYGAKENVFSPLAKIAAEPAKKNSSFVHLRLCCSNRYLQMKTATDRTIVAVSNQPDEDTSKFSCTLFQPVTRNTSGAFCLIHVNTGGSIRLNANIAQVGDNSAFTVKIVDWGTLIKLPPHVAFKGDNGKYLKAYEHYNGTWHLTYQSEDRNDVLSGHRVQLMGDGHVRFYSDHFKRYWRLNPNWIVADSSDETGQDTGTLFWPIKLDGTIALRCKYNNKFCKRFTEAVENGLAADVDTITTEARMQVEELVMNRRVYNVTYLMDKARIFNESPYLAGTTTLVNDSDFEAVQSASITYQDEKSYTFSRGFSMTAGVTTSIKAGLPFIAEGKIEVSFEIGANLQWDTTTTTTTSVTASGSVKVPPKSRAIVDYVGTKGTCDIPYSYTQEDQSSADGSTNRITHIDGTYKGVSCYNFSFRVTSTKSLHA